MVILEARIKYDKLNVESKAIIKQHFANDGNSIVCRDISENNLEISWNNEKFLIDEKFNIIEKVEGSPYLWEYSEDNRRITKYTGTDLDQAQEITIPNYINGTWITSIRGIHSKESIFGIENTNINKIIIPEGIVSLETTAFAKCKGLSTIQFPNSLEKIDWGVFNECTSLTGDLTIPENVTHIGQAAFDKCTGLNGTLTIGSKIQVINTYAFAQCNFKKVVINSNPSNVLINPGQCFKADDVIWLK